MGQESTDQIKKSSLLNAKKFFGCIYSKYHEHYKFKCINVFRYLDIVHVAMSVKKYFMQNIINNKGLEKEVNLKRYEIYPVWIIYLC